MRAYVTHEKKLNLELSEYEAKLLLNLLRSVPISGGMASGTSVLVAAIKENIKQGLGE